MKNKILVGGTMLLLAAASAFAGENENARSLPDGQGDLYRANELSVDVSGTASLGKYSLEHLSRSRVRHRASLGAGAGLSYFITRNVGIGVDAYSENTSAAFVDNASANLILRLPLGECGFAPYLFGGGGHQFEGVKAWFAQVGVGMEYRFTRNVGAFLDVRGVVPEETKYYGLGRLGLRFAF